MPFSSLLYRTYQILIFKSRKIIDLLIFPDLNVKFLPFHRKEAAASWRQPLLLLPAYLEAC
jgi:hypothetical protein